MDWMNWAKSQWNDKNTDSDVFQFDPEEWPSSVVVITPICFAFSWPSSNCSLSYVWYYNHRCCFRCRISIFTLHHQRMTIRTVWKIRWILRTLIIRSNYNIIITFICFLHLYKKAKKKMNVNYKAMNFISKTFDLNDNLSLLKDVVITKSR